MAEKPTPSPLPFTLIGFLIGALIGSSVGIAALGSAISGTIPLGLLGGYFGYVYGPRWFRRISKSRSPEELLSETKSGVAAILGTLAGEIERRKLMEQMRLDELEEALWGRLMRVEVFLTEADGGWIEFANGEKLVLDSQRLESIARRAVERAEQMHLNGISRPEDISESLTNMARETPFEEQVEGAAIAVLSIVDVLEDVIRRAAKNLKQDDRHLSIIKGAVERMVRLNGLLFGGETPPMFRHFWPLCYGGYQEVL